MAYKPTLIKYYQPRPNNASWKILGWLLHQITSENNQNLVPGRILGKWTKHHITIGVWPAYTNIDHTKIWLPTKENEWHLCRRFGTQLRFHADDPSFKPTQDHIPIQVRKLSNNKQYYSVTTTVPPKTKKPM